MQHNLFQSLGRTIVISFAIFFALAAFGLRYIQKNNHKNAWRLTNEGEISTATIINKRTQTSQTSSKNNYNKPSGITSYIIEYSFPLIENDTIWAGDDNVSEETYNTV